MFTRRVMLVAITALTVAGAALVGPSAVSPAAAATQGSCKTETDNYSFLNTSCTNLPDRLKYFAWVQCLGNNWGFGATESGTSGVVSYATCPNGYTPLMQGGLNINQGTCQVLTNNESYSGVLCTGLPYNLSYFAWIQCGNNEWGFGPTEPGTSGQISFAQCPNGNLILQGGFNVG